MNNAPTLLAYWEPPNTTVRPVGLVATSFTFEPTFFRNDCLARFLGLDLGTGQKAERTAVSLKAALLAEEEALADAAVSVIVDRSGGIGADRDNLRWDLIPVALPNHGLVHGKVTVLVWDNCFRVLIGSANLTEAGYRIQRELIAAIDIGGDAVAADERDVAAALLDEVEYLITEGIPKAQLPDITRQRAVSTIAAAREIARRVNVSKPPYKRVLALAVGHGTLGDRQPATPLDGLKLAYPSAKGKPTLLRVAAPYWDVPKPGHKAPAVYTELRSLVHRSGGEMSFAVASDQVARAPHFSSTSDLVPKPFVGVVPTAGGDEHRRYHAKAFVLENPNWVAAMIGSSNPTANGLGLLRASHWEVNVCVGVERTRARTATVPDVMLRALVGETEELPDPGSIGDELRSEDAPLAVPLPAFFGAATAHHTADGWELRLRVDRSVPEPNSWVIDAPGRANGDPTHEVRSSDVAGEVVTQPVERIPAIVDVRFHDDDGEHRASWPVLVADHGALPAADELRDLPLDVILDVLAETRRIDLGPALERALIDEQRPSSVDHVLEKYNSPAHLFNRIERYSRSLAGLAGLLRSPVRRADQYQWRVSGPLGVRVLRDRLVDDVGKADAIRLPGETQFMLVELALTLAWAPPVVDDSADDDGRVASEVHEQWRTVLLELLADIEHAGVGQDDSLTAEPAFLAYVAASTTKIREGVGERR